MILPPVLRYRPCMRHLALASRPRPTMFKTYFSLITSRAATPPLAVAIVGSGPAGFYTAQKLIRELDAVHIDMYEQLPVPFGLVRFGVAPDHPEVKNCQDSFQSVATSPNFTFVGNVNLGHDISLSLLAQNYDAVVFAYGASKDRKLGLEGEDKRHIYSARAFVGWYNGLPEYRDLKPDLAAGDDAIVVGQGNVALDVARTLLTDIDVLRKTDITDYALETLSRSRIKNVRVVGRRGPLQAAFTIKEVRELLQLPGVNFTPIPSHLFPKDLAELPRPKKRILELLKKGSPVKPGASKSWSLEFLLSPSALDWSADESEVLKGVRFVRNELTDPSSPGSRIQPTSGSILLAASTMFRSIGYKAEPIAGMRELGIQFDDVSGTLIHDGCGRMPHTTDHSLARPYCAGWVKRGPTGVIASTMNDAFETAQAIVADWKTSSSLSHTSFEPKRGWLGVKEGAQAQGSVLHPVHWANWEAIDQAERAAGLQRGKPREKLGTVEEMLRASDAV